MISICTPTRGRINQLKEMMTSAMNNAGVPIEFVLYVDDDIETYNFLLERVARIASVGHGMTVLTGKKALLSQYWNRCADAAHGDILMLANDDIVFRTQGWAKIIEPVFEPDREVRDRIKMVHVLNGQENGPTFGTHPFVSREWVQAVGFLVPPCLSGDNTDTWLNDLANGIGRRVHIPTVMIEHMHHTFGKSKMDETYKRRLEEENDTAVLYEGLWPLRDLAILKLKEAINSVEIPDSEYELKDWQR